jgi:hypothetical protein
MTKLRAVICRYFMCSLLSNGVAAAARPTPYGFPFPNKAVPLVFVHVDGKEASSARGSKYNEKVGPGSIGYPSAPAIH